MNDKQVKYLINEIRNNLTQLEMELQHYPNSHLPSNVTYEDVIMYEEYNNDEVYPS